MPPYFPPILAPYLEQALTLPSLTLLTSVLETPANSILVRFLAAALYGVDEDDSRRNRVQAGPDASDSRTKVVFLSVYRPFDLWNELCKKIAVDLPGLLSAKRIAYVDGLSIYGSTPSTRKDIIRPKSLELEDIKTSLNAAIQSLASDPSSGSKVVAILDGVDFILASQADLTAVHVPQFLTGLQAQVHSVVLTCAADAPLLHNVDESATPLELQHGTFIRAMAHQSDLVISMRPLETGHAQDVSGIIQISPRDGYQEQERLIDGEWLYRIKGDGSLRIWSRGE